MLKNKCRIISILVVLILPVWLQLGEASLYKWKDKDGNTHFSDELPEDVKSEPLQPPPLSILSGNSPVQKEGLEKDKALKAKPPKESYHCAKYTREINKISIYLQHTPNDRDKQKLIDLKQQLKLECKNGVYRKKYKNSHCHRYARKLNKYTIYNKHTPNDKDQQIIKDLKQQIALECR